MNSQAIMLNHTQISSLLPNIIHFTHMLSPSALL